MKMSSFILSLVSPVLRTIVCGNFKESISKRISLDDVEGQRFLQLVGLACGEDGLIADSIEGLLECGELAERLQMEAVRSYIEETVLKEVKEGNCLEMLERSDASGLRRLREGCYKVLRDEFEDISQKERFLRMTEETISNLLDEDALGPVREETVFEALVNWMKASEDGLRGEGLLKKIRYGAIDHEYLAESVLSALPGHAVLQMLVGEAQVKRRRALEQEGIWDGVERLCDKWMAARKVPAPMVKIPAGTILGSQVLKEPRNVAINAEGHILVSDDDLHQIVVFSSDGSVAQRIGSKGAAAGQFDGPRGIAVGRKGCIVVADRNNHRIQVLNADGSVVRCFGSKGNAVGQLDRPQGVAIGCEDHIVVADCQNHRIQVFNANGSVVRHFGSAGAAIGQFFKPMGVTVDGAGRIVVAENGNHRVQVFNRDGSVALCFGSFGNEPGQFDSPSGVAVDWDGRFVVADMNNDRVQVFNSDGTEPCITSGAGTLGGRLSSPFDVVLDGAGRIIATETVLFRGDYHRIRIL